MEANSEFRDWLARIRAGDEVAAEELVRHYEQAVRIAVRVRLKNSRLRKQFDSVDICQSVMASFFVRAAAGQFVLEHPEQLVALLVRMAQNKFAMQARDQHRQKRDASRETTIDSAMGVGSTEPTPDRVAAGRDLLNALYSRLSEEERAIAERRGAGNSWDQIAAELGGTAQARRKQLARAIDRVAPTLGIDEFGEE